MGSTSFDGTLPAQTGPDAVINLGFRGTIDRVTKWPSSGH
jgi:hypothetical protein